MTSYSVSQIRDRSIVLTQAEVMAQTFDIQTARKAFPALHQSHQVYFDNAGGSQVLGTVASS